MIEVKKHGMTIQVGLGTESESPAEVTNYPLYGPYRIWFKAFGMWAPTTWPGCAYDLAETLKKLKNEDSLCRYIERIL